MDVTANISAIVAKRVKATARLQIGNAMLIGLSLFLMIIALVAAISALGVVLATFWGVLAACLILAAISIAFAIGLLLVVAQRTKEAQRKRQDELEQWHLILSAAKVIVPSLTKSRALFVATALGLMFGLTGTRKP